MSRPKRKSRIQWHRVTNELVLSFAVKDCPRCSGAGMFTTQVNGGEQRPVMCACVDAPFKKEYEGRLRRTDQGRLEYREMSVAEELDAGS